MHILISAILNLDYNEWIEESDNGVISTARRFLSATHAMLFIRLNEKELLCVYSVSD